MHVKRKKRKELLLKTGILLAVAAILFVVLSPVFYRVSSPGNSTSYQLQHPDVSILYQQDGTARVRVDESEVVIPNTEMDSHPLAKEAWRRIMERGEPAQPVATLQWSRVIGFWLVPVLVLYWLLFRWYPRGEHVLGR